MDNNQGLKSWLNTKFALGLCIIIAFSICAYVFYQTKSFDNTLSVTGSATKNVVSDRVKWVSSISKITKLDALKNSHASLATDLSNVQAFLKANNIPDTSIVVSPVSMEQNYDQNYNADKTYTLRQTIEVSSSDVAAVTNLTKHIQPLLDKGMVFTTQYLEYTYSKLAEERIAMLATAMQDAKARAAMLAQSTGKNVGKLKSASSGVVQVLSENSLDISDYGSYDTSKINKTIMLTVKASFTLE